MAYTITDEDWIIANQPRYIIQQHLYVINPDDGTVISEIEGVVSGLTITENAESDVRKTASFVITPKWSTSTSLSYGNDVWNQSIQVNEESLIWINKYMKIQVGIHDVYADRRVELIKSHIKTLNAEIASSESSTEIAQYNEELAEYRTLLETEQQNYPDGYKFYNQGTYLFTDTSSTYDATTNQLTVNCSDLWAKFDGTSNGQIGAFTEKIPAYEELMLYSWYKKACSDIHGVNNADKSITRADFISWMNNTNQGDHENILSDLTDETVLDHAFAIVTNWDLDEETIETYMAEIEAAVKAKMAETSERDYLVTYNEDRATKMRNIIMYNIIRDVMQDVVSGLGGIDEDKTVIGDFGAYKALQENNDDYLEYRAEHDLWNTVPYDLEFSAGTNVASVITELRDIYPNFETYFDEDVFYAGRIPSNYYDPVIITNEQLQSILISESTTTPLNEVRNVCEILGASLEVDWYKDGENVTLVNSDTYQISIDEFGDKYYAGDKIGLQVPTDSVANQKIQVLSKNDAGKAVTLDAEIIYDPSTDEPIEAGRLKAGEDYVFKCKKTRINNKDVCRFYVLGSYQVHAIDVLSGVPAGGTDSNGNGYTAFVGKNNKGVAITCTTEDELKAFFKDKYNCDLVNITYCPDSPFTIQKIGAILDVKSDDEFSSIESDSEALERAKYENWKNCRLTDTITLTTKAVPFIGTNIKVEYQKKNYSEVNQYIIKQVATSWDSFTSTLTLMTFYPLYDESSE